MIISLRAALHYWNYGRVMTPIIRPGPTHLSSLQRPAPECWQHPVVGRYINLNKTASSRPDILDILGYIDIWYLFIITAYHAITAILIDIIIINRALKFYRRESQNLFLPATTAVNGRNILIHVSRILLLKGKVTPAGIYIKWNV